MNLPHIDDALVERSKVVEYLLAFDHPEGAGKAEFFFRFGFTAAEWERLADVLLAHGRTHPVVSTSKTVFGTKYRIDGPIACPDGRSPSIRTVWIVDAGTQFPRLVTAHPIQYLTYMIKVHDRVVLTTPLPDEGLEAGDIGAVVHIYPQDQAYEVEFVTLTGTTAAIVTVSADQIRPVGSSEIPHARLLTHS